MVTLAADGAQVGTDCAAAVGFDAVASETVGVKIILDDFPACEDVTTEEQLALRDAGGRRGVGCDLRRELRIGRGASARGVEHIEFQLGCAGAGDQAVGVREQNRIGGRRGGLSEKRERVLFFGERARLQDRWHLGDETVGLSR